MFPNVISFCQRLVRSREIHGIRADPGAPRPPEVATTVRIGSKPSQRVLGIVYVRGDPCAPLPGLQTAKFHQDPAGSDLVQRFVSTKAQSTVDFLKYPGLRRVGEQK